MYFPNESVCAAIQLYSEQHGTSSAKIASWSFDEVSEEAEEIIEKCLEVIQVERRASTSLLQRRLRLGYTRAARLKDILEMRGIIGPGDGAKPREILVDLAN